MLRVIFCVKPDNPCPTEKLREALDKLPLNEGDGSRQENTNGWPEKLDEARGAILCETIPKEFIWRIDRLRRKLRDYGCGKASAGILFVSSELPGSRAGDICGALIEEARGKFGGEAFAVSVQMYGGKRATFCHSFLTQYRDCTPDETSHAWPLDAFGSLYELIAEGYIEAAELRRAVRRVRQSLYTSAGETWRREIYPLFDKASKKGEAFAQKHEMTLADYINEYELDLDGSEIYRDTFGMTLFEQLRMFTICSIIGEMSEREKDEEYYRQTGKSRLNQESLAGQVGLFYVTQGDIRCYTCAFDDARRCEDGVICYHESMHELWSALDKKDDYAVEYDYFPWAKLTYDSNSGAYLLEHDACIPEEAKEISRLLPEGKCVLKIADLPRCHCCDETQIDFDIRE